MMVPWATPNSMFSFGLLACFIMIQVGAMDLRNRGQIIKERPPIPDYSSRAKFIPRTITLSATLGLPQNNKENMKKTYKKIDDNNSYENYESLEYDYDNKKNINNPRLETLSYGGNTEKINFYTIKCSSKEPCTSIIPNQENIKIFEPSKKRTGSEMRKYLNRYNLGRGFQYTGDDVKDSKTVVAKFIKDIDEKADIHRVARKIHNVRDNSNGFWPGQEYRPKNPSYPNLQRTKYDQTPPLDKKLSPQYYRETYSSRPSRDSERIPHRPMLPSPSFKKELNWPYHVPNPSEYYNEPPPPKHPQYKGAWNRFSSSTISQLDPQSGDWVKVSSSNTNLDNGYDAHPHNSYNGNNNRYSNHHPSQYMPPDYSHNQGESHHQTSVGLTVLGLNDHYDHPQISPPSWVSVFDGLIPNIETSLSTESVEESIINEGISDDTTSSYSSYIKPIPAILDSNEHQIPMYLVPNTEYNVPHYNKTTLKITTPSTTTTTTTPTTTTTTTTTTQQPQPVSATVAETQRPYAMMAAIGAGLIPATFAALLPVFIGKRKRRRRRWVGNAGEDLNNIRRTDNGINYIQSLPQLFHTLPHLIHTFPNLVHNIPDSMVTLSGQRSER